MTRLYWVAAVQGKNDTLDLARNLFMEPFEPLIGTIPNHEGTVLQSSSFQTLSSAVEVADLAKSIIEKINGVMRCAYGFDTLQFDGVLEVLDTGKVNKTAFIEGIKFTAKFGMTVALSGGASVNPQPSLAQRWLSVAATDHVVSDLIYHFSREPNWYDLYKVFECLRELKKRLAPERAKKFWPTSTWISNFTHTANFYRHSAVDPARQNPPKHPMPLTEAATKWADITRHTMDLIS